MLLVSQPEPAYGVQAAAKEDEEDLDALLAELGETPPAAAFQAAAAETQDAEAPAEADAAAEGADEDTAEIAVRLVNVGPLLLWSERGSTYMSTLSIQPGWRLVLLL